MSMLAHPTNVCYSPSAASSTVEQGSLSVELSKQTSTLETDKLTQSNSWWSSLTAFGDKESFVAFCGDILHFNDDDIDDQISKDALIAALSTTQHVYAKSPYMWRKPRIATDGGGGVRLTWKSGEKELRAVFPADMRRTQYLYAEDGDEYSTIKNFTPITLRNKLEWLLSKR